MRKWLYWLARLFGDVNAVRKGRIHHRIGNKIIGRTIARRLWF